MTPKINRFERLVALARKESTASRDISRRVMAEIDDRRRSRSVLRPMRLCVTAYALVCAIALILFVWQYTGAQDPMLEFFALASEIAP